MAALLKNMLQARLISNKEGEAKDQVLFLWKQVQAEDFTDQLLILQHHSCDTQGLQYTLQIDGVLEEDTRLENYLFST